jgi:uncharacterized protein YxjI
VSESSADGKALRLRKTFHLEEMQGRRLCTIHKRVMHIRDTMEIEGPRAIGWRSCTRR